MHEFFFATDSEVGVLFAESFDEACSQLEDMITDEMLDDGAWGWVFDAESGQRFKVGKRS